MQPSPENNNVIKLAIKVFRYDEVLTTWGWTHDVYYDIESQTYLVADFPVDGDFFELSFKPEPGPAEMTVRNKTYRVRVYETHQ